jgi:integrase
VPQKFTDITVNTLPIPATGRKTYWEHPLGVRVTAKGIRSYIVIAQSGDRKTLGRVGVLSLREARLEAFRLKSEYHPTKYKAPPVGLPEARTRYLAAITVRPPTRRYYERFLNQLPNLPLADIDYTHILRILDQHVASQQYVALRSFSAFFRWCIPRYLKYSPCTGLKVPPINQRSRVLSDEELGKIWICLERGTNLPASFCRIVQLLMLTGMRRTECSLIEKSWIKTIPTWTLVIPAAITKNRREHCLPLSATSVTLLTKIMTEQSDASSRIFSAKTGTSEPYAYWSKPRAHLVKITGVTEWVLHDLRRTYASNMARIGAPLHVIERLLNHITGSISGVAAIYNRHSYANEMREWQEKYEDFFMTKIITNA